MRGPLYLSFCLPLARPPRSRQGARPAVSLLDVLVVCGIVLLLLAMLLPSLGHAREQARRIICANNLSQWGRATAYYREEHNDYLPTEGTDGEIDKPYTWFNVLPPYLHAPAYRDVEGVGKSIKDFPELHVWICPSKNVSRLFKSEKGKNQFHYGMNLVLDGVGPKPHGSPRTPGFPDGSVVGQKYAYDPISARWFSRKPYTVFMFDIYPNSPCGMQDDVRPSYHRDYANVLYLDGAVDHFASRQFVEDGDYERRILIWNDPRLYWGYTPPRP